MNSTNLAEAIKNKDYDFILNHRITNPPKLNREEQIALVIVDSEFVVQRILVDNITEEERKSIHTNSINHEQRLLNKNKNK